MLNKIGFCLKDTDRYLGKTVFLSISNRQHVISYSVKNNDNTKYKNRQKKTGLKFKLIKRIELLKKRIPILFLFIFIIRIQILYYLPGKREYRFFIICQAKRSSHDLFSNFLDIKGRGAYIR